MNLAHPIPLASIILTFAGCSIGPEESLVAADFRRDNAAAVLTSVDVIPIDVGGADAIIKFRVPPDTSTRIQVWFYIDSSNGRWGLARKRDSTIS